MMLLGLPLLTLPRLLNAGARKGIEMARVGISERPKAVRRAELRSKPFNTEVEEEEVVEEEEGRGGTRPTSPGPELVRAG